MVEVKEQSGLVRLAHPMGDEAESRTLLERLVKCSRNRGSGRQSSNGGLSSVRCHNNGFDNLRENVVCRIREE